MKCHEFLAAVRERGEYADQAEAERVTRIVLELLGQRLTPGEAKDLAAQLPGELQDAVVPHVGDRTSYGVTQFLRLLGDSLGATEQTALWDSSAVFTTVADAVSRGQLNQVLSQLPSGYAQLFGKPELT